MIGLSEGNGHPFSFSAIINGYSDDWLYRSGWKVIHDYVTKRDSSEFGFEDVRVTDAWTQDQALTERLCKACLIPHASQNPEDMINKVDAVILARDDYDKHFEMAMPFLKAGKYVFIDKPLSLNPQQLNQFRPYLENGRLMSCSGMRYAIELDDIRKNIAELGQIMLIHGIAPNSWEKYGIHLLEAIFNIVSAKPTAITSLDANHTSMVIHLDDGALIQINNLGSTLHPFKLEFIGTKKMAGYEIKDNFSMFRRTLWHFIQQVKTGEKAIPPETTMMLMRLLIAGQLAMKEKRTVSLDEIN